MTNSTKQLRFIFTSNAFYPDITDAMSEEEKKEAEKWLSPDTYQMLYHFASGKRPENLSSSARFLFEVSASFFQTLTDLPELEIAREKVKLSQMDERIDYLLDIVPFGLGTEYINASWIKGIFKELLKIYRKEIKAYEGTVSMYLAERDQDLHVPERIFFHLVENKDDETCPFAFMATYASKDENGKVKHYPLKYALTEYKNDREKLLTLLSCLSKAADVSELIAEFMVKGELFHPLRLTSEEAFSFLNDIEKIEATGILCRIPNWWRKKAMNVNLSFKIGEDQPSLLGFDSLMSANPSLTIDGVELTEEDIRDLLNQSEGLAMLKGKWIRVDHTRLRDLLEKMKKHPENLTLMDAMRMEMEEDENIDVDNGVTITNGQWLSSLLNNLRHPEHIRNVKVPEEVQANLRPYQKVGYEWLSYMDTLGFGACLADDMGLGKTLQVLTYLTRIRDTRENAKVLLIAPASLLGNWQKEAEKFVPDLDICLLHGISKSTVNLELHNDHFLYITTYGMANRLVEALEEIHWDTVILDEAQAIKNPKTKQTRAIKQIPSRMRIAMTGTPIENDLGNLWSLFDFLNKGLLGNAQSFNSYCNSLDNSPEQYLKLKNMISPFMLRRMKTDKKIIKDLPDKIEMIDHAQLSRKQVVLYHKYLDEMKDKVEGLTGFERRGIILASLIKLKQICNHPDQYLGNETYDPSESGKFEVLKEICETIYEKRERVLVFTQFKEITPYLCEYLESIFHSKGYIIHGGISPKKRTEIVEEFQSDKYVPFIICSVKAAGTGLNLTKANHVIHFDRWWNPAVENQATDRAFRIGQDKNVMVHKLVCTGTIEEKIDMLIESKKELAENVIGSGGENWITELNDKELFDLLKLED